MSTPTPHEPHSLLRPDRPVMMYPVPPDTRFDEDEEGAQYMTAGEMKKLAGMLIEAYPELAHIKGARVEYLWRRKGTKNKGQLVYGTCARVTGREEFLTDNDFAITLAANWCTGLSYYEIEALLYHELCHIGQEIEEESGEAKTVLVGHEFEGFTSEMNRYGLWRPALKIMAQKAQGIQLPMAFEGESAPEAEPAPIVPAATPV